MKHALPVCPYGQKFKLGDIYKRPIRRFIFIMKLTGILLLVLCLKVSASVYSQEVALKAKDTELEKIFEQIRKQTGYNFLYSNKTLNDAKPVSVDKKAPLREFMDDLFKDQPLTYSIMDKTILVKKKELQESKSVPPIDIVGKVTDEKGEPLVGATIKVKGSTTGTAADVNGQFSLKNISDEAVLVISFTGFKTEEVAVKGRKNLSVVLAEDATGLNEVVILGFGQTQKKIAQTGSTASISNKELMQSPVSNITNALAGRLPGLIAVQRSGEPGRDKSDLYIRGRATLNSTAPLVTIDGVQKDYSAITSLDPNEIENITILKDASATALYGVKGANGVVIVTTKRGKEGKPVISLRTQTAIQSPTRMPEFLGSYDFARLYNEAYLNDNPTGTQLPYS